MFNTGTPSTQAIPNTLTPTKWAKRINDAWQKQLPSILEVGSLLGSAKEELRRGEWMRLVKGQLPFGQSTANKLMKIAACDHLRNSEHVPNLPAHWGTLHELTTLTEQQFEHGIKSGAINPKMQRKDVRVLRGDQPKSSNNKLPSLRAQLAQAYKEIEQLKRNGGDLFSAKDTPRDIANVLFQTLSASKFEKVISAYRELEAAKSAVNAKKHTGMSLRNSSPKPRAPMHKA